MHLYISVQNINYFALDFSQKHIMPNNRFFNGCKSQRVSKHLWNFKTLSTVVSNKFEISRLEV